MERQMSSLLMSVLPRALALPAAHISRLRMASLIFPSESSPFSIAARRRSSPSFPWMRMTYSAIPSTLIPLFSARKSVVASATNWARLKIGFTLTPWPPLPGGGGGNYLFLGGTPRPPGGASPCTPICSCFHHLQEFVKDILVVSGAGGGLGVVLDGEDGQVSMGKALHGAVVEVYLAHLQLPFKAVAVQGVAVVLGGDKYPPRFQVLYRVVGPPVAELQLEGLPAKDLPQDLVPQAYPQDGLFPDKPLCCLDSVVQQGRVPRARGEDY